MTRRQGCNHFFTEWYDDPNDPELVRRNCGRCGWNQRWNIVERGDPPRTKPNPKRSSGVTHRQAQRCHCGQGWQEIPHNCQGDQAA